MNRPSETISFRATKEVLRMIDTARSAFGLSRGDWVRGVVTAHLHQERMETVTRSLVDLRLSLDEVLTDSKTGRIGMARMLFSLLTLVGQVDSIEAKEIVRQVFGTSSQGGRDGRNDPGP